jgi:hypothetical protein
MRLQGKLSSMHDTEQHASPGGNHSEQGGLPKSFTTGGSGELKSPLDIHGGSTAAPKPSTHRGQKRSRSSGFDPDNHDDESNQSDSVDERRLPSKTEEDSACDADSCDNDNVKASNNRNRRRLARMGIIVPSLDVCKTVMCNRFLIWFHMCAQVTSKNTDLVAVDMVYEHYKRFVEEVHPYRGFVIMNPHLLSCAMDQLMGVGQQQTSNGPAFVGLVLKSVC